MAIHSRRWTRQPQEVAGVNEHHPLAAGLVALVAPPFGDAVRRSGLSLSAGASISPSAEGLVFQGSASNAQVNFGAPGGLNTVVGTGDFSIFFRVFVSGLGTRQFLLGDANGSALVEGIRIEVTAASLWATMASYGGTQRSRIVGSVSAGWQDVHFNSFAGTRTELFVNDVLVNDLNYSGSGELTTGTALRLMSVGLFSSLGWLGQVALAAFWSRTLSEAELRAVRAAPWQLFAPRRIWVPQAAISGLPTLSLPTYTPGSLTATGFRPRVTAS